MSNESMLALAAIVTAAVEAAKLAFDIVKWREEHRDPDEKERK